MGSRTLAPHAGSLVFARKKPKAGERQSKGDGSIVLVCSGSCPAGLGVVLSAHKDVPGRDAIWPDNLPLFQTTNNAYTVSKLPALPERIRADSQSEPLPPYPRPSFDLHLSTLARLLTSRKTDNTVPVYSSSGYALSLTHTHALVWPYTSTTPSPETFTFALPYPSKHASDPLPLGSLVSPSASSEEPRLGPSVCP